jgi:hypothetical protein
MRYLLRKSKNCVASKDKKQGASPYDKETSDAMVAADIKNFNKRFYESFDTQYFIQKCLYLLALMENPKLVNTPLEKGIEIGKLKVSLGQKELDETFSKSFVSNLRSEIALTYFHSLETLFRLIVAHSNQTECPWIDLTEITSFKKFKKDVKKITQHKFYVGKHEDAIAALFFGKKTKPDSISKERWNKNLENLVQLLDIYGGDLLDSHTYNTYKHGLALFTEDFGFSLGDIIKVEKDDAFVMMNNEKDKEHEGYRQLSTSYSFTFWQRRFAMVHIITLMLENIINIGKGRYLDEKNLNLHLFDTLDPIKILRDDDNPFQPNSVKMSSFSYKKG